MNPKISIIVPVYKVELYLEKCIDSILNQTFKDFELILVDDGSPDRCGEICDEYAKKDNRIKVIHKENGGLSSARNAGLDIAKGEYIGFVDSDDWIEVNMYEVLYNLCCDNDADIVSCKALNLYEGKDIVKRFNEKKIKLYEGKINILDAHYNREFNFSLCTKLIKTKKINKLRFKEGMISEDVIFMIKLYNQIERLVYTTEQKYIYFHRKESITTSGISFKRLDNLYHSIDLYNYLDNRYKNQVIKGAQGYSHGLAIEIVNEKTIFKNRKLLKNIKVIFQENKFLRKEKDIKISLFLQSPLLYCIIYRIGKEIKNIFKRG
ncbi:MAG: glycosyltransferase family 2 protein [Clostridium sp.]